MQVVQVGEQNGLRFPREFALLIKQLLYFDRWTSDLPRLICTECAYMSLHLLY